MSDTKARKAVPAATTNRSFSPRADNHNYQAPNHAAPTESLGFPPRIPKVDGSRIPRYVTEAQDQSGKFGYSFSYLYFALCLQVTKFCLAPDWNLYLKMLFKTGSRLTSTLFMASPTLFSFEPPTSGP
jgi:hypothetical protein